MGEFSTRLQHARARLMGTATETVPVPYRVSCSCGETLEGQRRNTWTQAQCDECGATQFILPVNVYPTSNRVPSLVLDGNFLQRLRTVVGEFLKTTEEAPAQTRQPQTPAAARLQDYAPPSRTAEAVPTDERGESSAREPVATGVTDSAKATEDEFAFPTSPQLRVRRRVFTPVRLLVAGALLAAIGTGWWISHQNRLESARNLWRSSMDDVESALEQGDLPQLLSSLTSAVDAATVLQKQDGEVYAAENLLLQVTALSSLSQIDLLREVDDLVAAGPAERSDAVRVMDGALAGQWFVLECPVRENPRLERGVELLMPEGSAAYPVHYVIDAEWLLEAQEQLGGAAPLIAVAIQDVRTDAAGLSGLVLRFDADQLALLTEPFLAQDAGLMTDGDAATERLQQQDAFVRDGGRTSTQPSGSREEDAS